MSEQRLTEKLAVGDRVEILLRQARRWVAGEVIALDPPGVWVATAVGRWYVTHPRRIRLRSEDDAR